MTLNSFLGLPTLIPSGKILCYVTGKLRNETPEEKVRQRVARSLVEEYGYKKTELGINFSIKLGVKRHPLDLVVFHESESHIQENVYIIVETKKEKIKPNDKNEGVAQLKSYLSACLSSQFGLWTNGIDRQCFRKIEDRFEEIIDIPIKGKSLEDYEKVNFDELRPALDLKSVFERCHNYIYANQGLQKTEAFHELLKIIFCKVQDEKSKELKFYITNQEKKSPHGIEKVKDRINELFEAVKKYPRYQSIFKKEEEKIELEPKVTAYIVSQLQHHSFLQTDTDVKGEAYEEIVGANLRGDRGEFFTPRNVCRMSVECLFSTYPEDRWINAKILDPACGTGGFLIAVINLMKQYLFEIEMEKWHNEETASNMIVEAIREYCEANLYAIDFNPLLVRAAQMNEVMHGNGSGNLFSINSLLHPTQWPDEMRKKIKLEEFDMVFTNPPFGSKIPIDDPSILEQYALGHVWDNDTLEKKDKIQSSVPPEELFIERCLQFLKTGGRMAIVLPDSILSNPGKKYIRYWILRNAKLLASIDLPRETFLPNVGTKTSVLILEKKSPDEIRLEEESSKMFEYETFMALPKYVGHDRRGNPIYKTTPEGEEILVAKEREIIRIVGNSKIKEREKMLVPEINDELPEIALEFKKWMKIRERAIVG